MRMAVEKLDGLYYRWIDGYEICFTQSVGCSVSNRKSNCKDCKISRFPYKFPGARGFSNCEWTPENCIFLMREEQTND